MNAVEAMRQTNTLVTGLIAGLTPEHREATTPCDEWTVHDLINHMCGGAHMIAAGMEGESQPPGIPEDMPDFLTDGPAAGWAAAAQHLAASATPEALAETHAMPFGETPGEMAVAIITADHLTHAWDLAKASGQELTMSDELATFALETWMPLVPAEGRTGDGFKSAIATDDSASAVEKLAGYTGRQP